MSLYCTPKYYYYYYSNNIYNNLKHSSMTNCINDSSIKQIANIRAPTRGNTNIDGIHKLYYQRDYNHIINNNIKIGL